MMDNQENAGKIEIDEHVRFQLTEAARWARFVGIAGIIFSALLLLAGIFINVIISGAPQPGMGLNMESMKGLLSLAYIIAGVVSFALSFFLFRFGSQASTALTFNRQDYLAHSFKNLKMVYRVMGMIIITYLIFTAIGMIFSLFSGPGR